MRRLIHKSFINTSSGPKQVTVELENQEPYSLLVCVDGKRVVQVERDRLAVESILDILKALQ